MPLDGCPSWNALCLYFESEEYRKDRIEELMDGEEVRAEDFIRGRTIYQLNTTLGFGWHLERIHYPTGITYLRRWYENYRPQDEGGKSLDRNIGARRTTIGNVRFTNYFVDILNRLKSMTHRIDRLNEPLRGVPFVVDDKLNCEEIERSLVGQGAFQIGFDHVEYVESTQAGGIEMVRHHYAQFAVHLGHYSYARHRAAKLKLYTVTDRAKTLQQDIAKATSIFTLTARSFDDVAYVASAAELVCGIEPIGNFILNGIRLSKVTIKFVFNFQTHDSTRIAYRLVQHFGGQGHTVSIFFENGSNTLEQASVFIRDELRLNNWKMQCDYNANADKDRPDFLVCALHPVGTGGWLTRLTMPVKLFDEDGTVKNCDAFDIIRHERETNTVGLLEFGREFVRFLRAL